ncbi:MAG: Ferredoxin--nitrite reductase (EC [uncultured Sulfurovum sp.]|uniref:Ferredoxin--nitrite reductase (EC) n=1 Tax=uncultured Sulfurovum sp. TaxID=269237 RepID=A0A6S6T074_9BACT|nr:MAG: Ferredoxin--nitrite reductase (EC [uncultured Sulfurovum sp.]
MSILETAFNNRNKKQNKVEATKILKLPMDVHSKLQEISAAGYEGLAKEDSAYFLKCFGLFDKKEDFMLRVRIPIGQLNNEQAIRIGEVAKKYGDDYIDLTTRMQIELRYLQIEDIATVLEELNEVGISTFQTGVDNPRNTVADPLEGLAFDNIIDVSPIVKELQSLVIENPEWISVLPRKFNTGILGSMSNACNIFGHDCCFVLANKEGEFGFNVYLGARVGIQAQDANVFVSVDEVPSFYLALLETFKTFGYRDNRNKNRLYFLLKDVGMTALVDEVKKRANQEFNTAGQTLVQSQNIALGANKVLQRNGQYAHKVIIPSGIFSGTDLIQLAESAKSFGSGDLRLTYDQNIYVVNINKSALENFESSNIYKKYAQYNNIYFNDMIACAGTKTCSFGVIPNKPDAIAMANFLKSEVGIESGVVRMNWSACPKGCGVHGIADIGLEGCKAKDAEGNKVDGVHIFMGGKITRTATEAKLLHKTLPITEAKYHIKYLLEVYAEFKERGETFETFESRYFARNYSYQALSFFTKINYILNDKLDLDIRFKLAEEPKTYKKENLEIFDFGLKLFKLLTNEKRYVAVKDFEPVLVQARKITRDEVTSLNPNVPKKLSEVIYMMTDNDKKARASVFSELLLALKGL